jgi:hypothetical protein
MINIQVSCTTRSSQCELANTLPVKLSQIALPLFLKLTGRRSLALLAICFILLSSAIPFWKAIYSRLFHFRFNLSAIMLFARPHKFSPFSFILGGFYAYGQ